MRVDGLCKIGKEPEFEFFLCSVRSARSKKMSSTNSSGSKTSASPPLMSNTRTLAGYVFLMCP